MPGSAQSSGQPSAAETQLIQKALAVHRVPGASIAVIHDHQLLWSAGFGIRRQGDPQPVDEATLFQAGSVSKPTLAMAVLLLAERGTLNLDEDVNLALRSWKLPETPVSAGGAVTVRRLLSHSAGISVHGFEGYKPSQPMPTLLEILNGQPPANSSPIVIERKPGEQFQYSGGGYCILQQLLVDLEKRPFEQIVADLVLKPCGMRRSSYSQPLPLLQMGNMAFGHNAYGGRVEGDFHVYPEQAAAGLWTTAADCARLLLAIDRAESDADPRVFSKSLVKDMMILQKGYYGLGWVLSDYEGHAALSHGGVNEGFHCFVWLCPSLGKGFAAFANSDNGSEMIGEIIEPLRSGTLR